MIDLNPFCLPAEFTGREYLKKPFSQGAYTYAVNGHILVRVPRRQAVPVRDKPNLDMTYHQSGPKPAGMIPLRFIIPKIGVCASCDGSGFEHDCPNCDCRCVVCSGIGNALLSLMIRGAIFDAKYICMIQALPNPRMALVPSQEGPTWFDFDGGDGLLMPMRSAHDNHIDAPEESAS